jgi:hypothetical protein
MDTLEKKDEQLSLKLKENTELVTQIPVIPGGTLTEETTKITADEAVPE